MAFIDEWRHWHHLRLAALGAPSGPLAGAPAGVEVFEPHHDWVVPAEVVDPLLDDATSAAGAVVRLVLDGRSHTLAVTRRPRGAFHLVFSDLTRDAHLPSRCLHVPAPDDGLTVLDFNRAVLPLAAFDAGVPAVVAPEGNYLDVAVTAGEHRATADRECVPV